MRSTKAILSAAVLLATWGGAIQAAEVTTEETSHVGDGQGEDVHGGEQAEEHGEHEHKNEFAFVLGGTYESEGEETLFTLGAEYARVLSPHVTATVVAEHLSDVDSWVFVAPFHIHPNRSSGFFVALGPGFEHKIRREHGEGNGEEHGEGLQPVEPEESENLFLWRTGVGYVFEVGKRWVVTPGLDLDVVRESGEWVEAIVFDVAIGFGF